jgi:hypothetical protein
MATQPKVDPPVRFADKEELRRLVESLNAQIGFVPDTDATPQRARRLMLADGIRPEDNAFSRDIIRMRRGDDE